MNHISFDLFSRKFEIKVSYILLFLILLAAFLRFYRLTYVSLWLDEIYSMNGADPDSTTLDVYRYSFRDQPPAFFLLLHFWLKLFGYTDFTGRALPAIYGIVGVIAIFFLGKELKDEKLGLTAAFITSINWFHVGASMEIRFYALVFLLSTLSFLFLIQCVKRTRFINFLGYTISTSILLNTHYFGMIVFVSQFVILLLIIIFIKRDIVFIASSLLTGIITGLSLYHYLPAILRDAGITQFHVEPVGWNVAFSVLWEFIREPLAFTVYMVCILLSLKIFYESSKQKKLSGHHLVIITWIFLGFSIPLVYSLLRVSIITPKYCTIILPAIILVIARGFILLSNKIKPYLILLVTLSAFVILFYARPQYKPRRSEDWREVARYFKDNENPNQVILSDMAWFHQYYFKKYGLQVPEAPSQTDVANLVRDKNEFWLVANKHYESGVPTEGLNSDQTNFIGQHFRLLDTVQFKYSIAYRYKSNLDVDPPKK